MNVTKTLALGVMRQELFVVNLKQMVLVQQMHESRDRFIMAPGVYVAAPTNNGEYTTLTGTLNGGVHVAGAVAIVHPNVHT